MPSRCQARMEISIEVHVRGVNDVEECAQLESFRYQRATLKHGGAQPYPWAHRKYC